MEFKEIKNLFTFQMTEAVFSVVLSEISHLTEVYEPLKTFTSDDLKTAYNANNEDLEFINAVIEKVPAIRAKGILVTDETFSRLKLKALFAGQMLLIASKLRKLADKLENAFTISLAEAYSISVTIHESVGVSARQGVAGAATIAEEISDSKTRAIRTAETRRKNEAAKRKEEKDAIVAEKNRIAAEEIRAAAEKELKK